MKGEAQLDSRSYPARIHLALDCLVVVDRTAYISGAVTASDNPLFPIGNGAAFSVTDDGEGAPWAPSCTTPETQSVLVFYPIESGNVQVR